MKITGNGVARQEYPASPARREKAPSNTFDALLGERVSRSMPVFERTGVLAEPALDAGSIVSPGSAKVLNQGEIRFFENLLHATARSLGNAGRTISDQLQSAITLNRPA